MILHERAAQFHAESSGGWLSIKCMFGGHADYVTPQGRFAVDDDAYLVLNHGEPYTIEIASRVPVESLCIFFEPAAAADVLRSLVTPADKLLDDPRRPCEPPAFVTRRYPHAPAISDALARLRQCAWGVERGRYDEVERFLLHGLLAAHRRVRWEIDHAPFARPATREELYRRLHIARDYLHACSYRSVPLEEAAGVAAMSPYHFLRAFQAMFGRTPHQYLTACRIRRAQRLLGSTDLPVHAVCVETGFESPSSFTRLFFRQTGQTPAAYRKSATSNSSHMPVAR